MTVVKPKPNLPSSGSSKGPLAFKATNWSQNELITQPKANVINDNMEWIFRNTPRAIYTLPGGGRDLRRVEGVKIASGRVIIASPTTASASGEVRFGNFFATGCEPNVTTAVISSFPGIACSVSGIGQTLPDQRGITVKVEINSWLRTTKPSFGETIYVSFNAMGY